MPRQIPHFLYIPTFLRFNFLLKQGNDVKLLSEETIIRKGIRFLQNASVGNDAKYRRKLFIMSSGTYVVTFIFWQQVQPIRFNKNRAIKNWTFQEMQLIPHVYFALVCHRCSLFWPQILKTKVKSGGWTLEKCTFETENIFKY